MTALLNWMTASPARAFMAGAATWLVAFVVGIAWLPAGVVVLAMLVGGSRLAAAAFAGAAILLLPTVAPVFGALVACVIVLAVLVPAYTAGSALASTRSLTLVYQWMTLGAVFLVLAIHALVGNPVTTLMPFMAELDPLLQQLARWLAERGIEATPEQLGTEAARVAWRYLAWLVLANALLAQFVGLWAFGKLREPGLFGREFRRLRLGGFIAWMLVASFVLTFVLNRIPGESWLATEGWLITEDVVFVLAAAFGIQALAVVHGLRDMQVIGLLPVILAYAAILLAPKALIGIGFADTWFRFRERFARR